MTRDGRGALPRLHAVTDERIAKRPNLDDVARALVAGGGERLALHARGRGLSGLEHYQLASRLAVYPPTRANATKNGRATRNVPFRCSSSRPDHHAAAWSAASAPSATAAARSSRSRSTLSA